jgi:hypothetical protein
MRMDTSDMPLQMLPAYKALSTPGNLAYKCPPAISTHGSPATPSSPARHSPNRTISSSCPIRVIFAARTRTAPRRPHIDIWHLPPPALLCEMRYSHRQRDRAVFPSSRCRGTRCRCIKRNRLPLSIIISLRLAPYPTPTPRDTTAWIPSHHLRQRFSRTDGWQFVLAFVHKPPFG